MKKYWRRWLLFEVILAFVGMAFFVRRRLTAACEPEAEIRSTMGSQSPKRSSASIN